MGIIDVHRILKKKEKASLSYSKWTHKAAHWVWFSNFWTSRDRGVWSNPHSYSHPTLDDELPSLAWPATSSSEAKKRSLSCWLIVLCSRYAYTALNLDQSIDRRLCPSLRTGDLLLPFLPYTPFSLVRCSIDSFTFVATNMFIVLGLQYLILHFDFTWATNIALWISWSYLYCTTCGLAEGVHIALLVSRKCIMVYILLCNNIVMGYKHYNMVIILWYNYVIQIYATATWLA